MINLEDTDAIRRVGEIVKRGGIIVYPTDTLYGMGGDPLNPDAVRRILAIKRRASKPMPVLVAGVEDAKKLVRLEGPAMVLAEAFWPGGLTIVAEKARGIPDVLTMGGNKLGVRMPRQKLTLKIIEASGGALIGTSANISGRSPARSVEELDSDIEKEVDLVIDGGKTELGVPSTVVDVGLIEEGVEALTEIFDGVRILRVGALGTEVIRSELIKRLGG